MNVKARLREIDNDHSMVMASFELQHRCNWHERTDASHWDRSSLSIVIPARNAAYCIGHVLDALLGCDLSPEPEVIIVDDGSLDLTFEVAHRHPICATVVKLRRSCGASVARNVGTIISSGTVVMYLDADMVLPTHVVREHIIRSGEDRVILGFRHGIGLDALTKHRSPDLEQDPRIRCRFRAGPLLHTGVELAKDVDVRPVDDTSDLRQLGFGRSYFDWDLPRMVVTAMVSMSRAAVIAVGGFHPVFHGWGMEDTHLGAKVIAHGLKVIPLKCAVGFHLDPPNVAEEWQRKLSTWRRNIVEYRALLERERVGAWDRIGLELAENELSAAAVRPGR